MEEKLIYRAAQAASFFIALQQKMLE